MKITVLVARVANGDSPWIVDAWDEWTEDENEQVREESILRARKNLGEGAELRTATVYVSDSFLEDCFADHEAEAM